MISDKFNISEILIYLYFKTIISIVMALNGVRQLKELLIRYSDYDGSSKGIREWMSTSLLTFAQNNPELMIRTERKRCVHPFVRGRLKLSK